MGGEVEGLGVEGGEGDGGCEGHGGREGWGCVLGGCGGRVYVLMSGGWFCVCVCACVWAVGCEL